MKLLVVVVGLVLAVGATDLESPIFRDYHEEIGIPAATRIRLSEDSMDFDGSRITGGRPSTLGAQPHLGGLVITLTNGRQSVCGSSLLTNNRLVTAAHCWRHRASQARQFTVVLASIRLFSGGTRINTSSVQMHASYNENNLNNDIAMINIGSVSFNNNINRILLPTGNNLFVGTWATAAGFGANGDNHPISQAQAKHQVDLQVITNAVCQSTYGSSVVVSSTLCVATAGARSTCGGDSGGPLAIGSGNNRQLIGVVSFGHTSGCQRGHPAGFARVTSFAAWIRQRL